MLLHYIVVTLFYMDEYKDLLIRLDQRMHAVEKNMDILTKTLRDAEARYVTHEELNARVELLKETLKPIQRIVYGMVAVILTQVLGAILYLVISF